jgi:hypothetical protein
LPFRRRLRLPRRLQTSQRLLPLLQLLLLEVLLCHTYCCSNAQGVTLIPTRGYPQLISSIEAANLGKRSLPCALFGGYSRPGLEIVLVRYKLPSAETSALAEVLGQHQGPTKLHNCDIDTFLLADGLRGNSRLKHLISRISSNIEDGNRQVLAIADAIRENKGLIEWHLRWHGAIVIDDGTWSAACDYLKTHPTLEELDHLAICHDVATTLVVIISWVQALFAMMEVSTSIHTIHLRDQYSVHELFREPGVPYLETNRFRLHIRAIPKTRPITYRAKVIGRALLAARTDANRFLLLTSGNAEVALPSTTASLPTPAIAADTSNTAAVATSAAVTVTAIRVASTFSICAVDIVATPTTYQKRKARP